MTDCEHSTKEIRISLLNSAYCKICQKHWHMVTEFDNLLNDMKISGLVSLKAELEEKAHNELYNKTGWISIREKDWKQVWAKRNL